MEVDGVILTDTFANATFPLFKEKAAFIDIGNKGNGLGEVYMDGFILRYLLIVLIRVVNRAVFGTGSTTRAFVL